jgi:hypothetical protein
MANFDDSFTMVFLTTLKKDYIFNDGVFYYGVFKDGVF